MIVKTNKFDVICNTVDNGIIESSVTDGKV